MTLYQRRREEGQYRAHQWENGNWVVECLSGAETPFSVGDSVFNERFEPVTNEPSASDERIAELEIEVDLANAECEYLKAENKRLRDITTRAVSTSPSPYQEKNWLKASTAESVASSWLTQNGHIRRIDDSEFVRVTRDNAGLVMAAYPEQAGCLAPHVGWWVCGRWAADREGSMWFRVGPKELCYATDAEREALEAQG